MEPTTTSSSPSSSSSSLSSSSSTIHQEEPLDLTTGNPTLELTADLQQQQVLQLMETYGEFMRQNIMSIFLQTLISSQNSNLLPIPEEPPENDSKENIETPKKVLMIEENELTPNQTKRRTSTGKVDRRMIGKATSRRTEANARERNRVQTLSKTFEELKICLPIDEDIKVSKLAILKVATEYIGLLGAYLAGDEEEEDKYRERLHHEMESAKALRK
ncbi:hypothetical protein CAEBREN_21713 [Caenorhabditis brenneri]|uniref:BHLH domain-containing protein n=1 Tax=Caenorhabditis brenneri TaxID=135651 RepID=G0NTV9_CAEBE|nr:hypothetical protein CAEBREN_21713 [Caenorhabditis brenneri]